MTISGLLGVAFIVLKLVGVIDWNWIWVLSPFWIPFGIVLVVLLAICIVSFVVYGVFTCVSILKREPLL